jgi:hypothetical protein
MGRTSPAIPRIRPTLAMFDPTTLPTASLGLPAKAAVTDEASSGAEVQKATTVRPTTSGRPPPRDRELPGATHDDVAAGDEQTEAQEDGQQSRQVQSPRTSGSGTYRAAAGCANARLAAREGGLPQRGERPAAEQAHPMSPIPPTARMMLAHTVARWPRSTRFRSGGQLGSGRSAGPDRHWPRAGRRPQPEGRATGGLNRRLRTVEGTPQRLR